MVGLKPSQLRVIAAFNWPLNGEYHYFPQGREDGSKTCCLEGCSCTFAGAEAAGSEGQVVVWAPWGGDGAAGPQSVQRRRCPGARAGFAAVDPAAGSSSKTWRSTALSCGVNKLARETILLQLVGETLFR